MQYLLRQHCVTSLSILLCLLLASCEGSPWGTSLEKNLEPDPRLLEEETVNDEETPVSPSGPPVAEVDEQAEAAPGNTSETADAEEPVAEPPAFKPSYVDIDEAPEELQQYIEDLVDLNVLMLIDVEADDNIERDPNEFLPNQIITRREYARWLLAVNNRFYSDQRTKKIRPAVSSSQPVFQDVGTTNIDFAAIQGLAEAGIIPSPLNGSSTAVTFRPNAPLTRKDLISWKVPLDTRAALPAATAAAVTEAWGFQDAGKIEPAALKAVLADHSNGEFANIRRALGYTTLFQPDKGVTRAEAAAVLWRFGNSTEGVSAADLLAADAQKSGESDENKDAKADESQTVE